MKVKLTATHKETKEDLDNFARKIRELFVIEKKEPWNGTERREFPRPDYSNESVRLAASKLGVA